MSKNFNLPEPNKNDCWVTPQYIVDSIGISELDPCGYKGKDEQIYVQTARDYYFIEDDGLKQKWGDKYKSIFVNFPYSDAKNWMDKCTYEYQKYKCEIIVLCFLRGETRWFQNNVNFATGINILKRRIKFLDSNGIIRGNGNAPSCLIAYGEESYKRIKNLEGICCRVDK